jgi:CHAD domain-containing protein
MRKSGKLIWNPRLGVSLNARRQLPAMMRGYFAQVRELLTANPKPAELHAIRLATKRVRYTLELFRPCYEAPLEPRIAELQRLQQILGEVNDCAAAEHVIDGLVAPSLARTRAQSFLRRRAAAKATELRREWRQSFDAPGREHSWLHYLASSARVKEPRL